MIGFFQALNVSDVFFQFFDEYYENIKFKSVRLFNRYFVEVWIGTNSVALLC